jgi:hypothetical protein
MPQNDEWLAARPEWRRTGYRRFPVAARVQGQWWVLRMNCFPDHPLWTLFVDGVRRFDINDVPPTWGRPADRAAPRWETHAVSDALRAVQEWDAYGSEVGDPCDDPFCCA